MNVPAGAESESGRRRLPASSQESAMTTATWNGVVLAESSETVVVEGVHYFPPDSVNPAVLQPSSTTSKCYWKGTARYYTVLADGQRSVDGAWTYAEPFPSAARIKNRVAFWRGARVT
jgi:uncharacterized protein (DUF427 family)